MKFKKFVKRLTAAVLTMTMATQFSAPTIQAAAASTTEYMSELILSYGQTDKEAKDWLTQNGYTVLNQNLNQGGEGGSDALSWLGLSSEKRSVYLGYKTTNDPKEAITDMKIMNMNGGYSYEAYEKVLEETKQEKEHFLETLMVALNEYRDNYHAGLTKAKIAHDNLNKFKDDDSGQLMGDLLLNSLKTEDEASWEADPTQHADMVTILMQGNSTCVSEIMQNLTLGAGTGETSWLNAALANSGSFDEFFQNYLEEHPGFTEDDAIAMMTAEYDDYAKMFASSLIGLQNYLSNYTQSQLSIDATEEEIAIYFEEHEFEKEEAWAGAANLYTTLHNISYGENTLADYLVYTEDDFLTDTSLLNGYEDFGLPQRAKLYPFIAEMSAGERTLLEYTALDRMITTGLMDESTWACTEATMNDPEYGSQLIEPCSMFAEINRDDFQVGSIAVTNMAQGKQASTGEPIDEGLFDIGISPVTAGLFIGGLTIGIAGVTVFAKNVTTSAASQTAKTTVEQGKSILHLGLDYDLAAKTESFYDVPSLIKEIENNNKAATNLLKDGIEFAKKAPDRPSPTLEIILPRIESGKRSYTLTFPGSDQEIQFSYNEQIVYDAEGNIDGVITIDGNFYHLNGEVTIDEVTKQKYDEAMEKLNDNLQAKKAKAPDKNAVQKADEAMDAATGSSVWKWLGAGMAVAGLALSIYSAWSAIDEMSSYYHMEMLPIPRKMVDTAYLEDGSSVYVYYDCTRCNRNEMNMQNETLEDYGDMNGDVMKEWLALYTTKDVRAGNPIQAGFTKKVGTTSIPMGKKPLSFFGFDYAVNMTDERFTYNDKSNGIYLYYTQSGQSPYSGTIETSNAYIAVGVLSALGGAGICALITNLTGKRKKQEIETV